MKIYRIILFIGLIAEFLFLSKSFFFDNPDPYETTGQKISRIILDILSFLFLFYIFICVNSLYNKIQAETIPHVIMNVNQNSIDFQSNPYPQITVPAFHVQQLPTLYPKTQFQQPPIYPQFYEKPTAPTAQHF